jgi:electron transfer flavoprotein alpha subunit
MSCVLVILESHDATLTRFALEALSAGQQLAAAVNLPLQAAVVGDAVQPLANEAAKMKLARVHAVEHPLLKNYTADGFTLALEQLIQTIQPAYILLPHSYQVRDFAPRLATRFQQTLISDVIAINPGTVFARQLFQGKLNADFRATGSTIFISVQAGSFHSESVESAPSPAEISAFTPQLTAAQIRTQPGECFRESTSTVDLSAAEIIVSVGRGIGSAENIAIAQSLATVLGAELAGSRPVCDNGWLPMERQVGSSGHTVSPKLYIAIGISGAIQHLVGMKGAKTIVAINKDEHAPIFEVADYGIVADLFEVVPALTKALLAAKSA